MANSRWYEKVIESVNWIRLLVLFAVAILLLGISMPLLVRQWYMRYEDYTGLASLGAVGDFLGGSTVGLLSTGSILLLLATLFMQRRELKISQDSIEQLVEQTKAAKEQAIEAREETRITNSTMKKQQFDSTFFNMINLHHNILKEIKFGENYGREVIHAVFQELKSDYDDRVYKNYSEKVKLELLNGDRKILNDFINKIFIYHHYSNYAQEFDNHFIPIEIEGLFDFTAQENFYKELESGQDLQWNKIKKEKMLEFKNDISSNSFNYERWLRSFSFKNLISNNFYKNLQSDEIVKSFNYNFYLNPLKSLKINSYEYIYKKHEDRIGHYYRNLYRIIKLIQEQKFDEDEIIDENEKQKYRGVLRAQLSAIELKMIFYNIIYSKKGEKFKEALINTNFFDDHLIPEKFIWANDSHELNKL